MNIYHFKGNKIISFIAIIFITSLIIFLTSVKSPLFKFSKKEKSQINNDFFNMKTSPKQES